MYIVIGADLVPTKSNEKFFEHGETEQILSSSALKILSEAEYRIFNLESPLCDEGRPIRKNGPNISAKINTLNGIKALNIDLLTLANNHIMDYGELGIKTTMTALKDAGIHYLGAGNNLKEAQKPYIFKFAEKRIGVYACTEHEFSIATDIQPGANPVDLLEIFDHISNLKKDCDYLIVLYHGGKEYYRYPSPDLQKICHKLADNGANLIIAQHSHCVGCKEEYNAATIVYGQGNFIFDKIHDEFWDEGLLITINENFELDYHPLRKCIMANFYDRSRKIEIKGFVEKEYAKYARTMYEKQTSPFRKKETLLFRFINKLTNNMLRKKRIYGVSEDKLLAQINYLECEAHRELLIKGLKSCVQTKNRNLY